jgi:hypothetical protein
MQMRLSLVLIKGLRKKAQDIYLSNKGLVKRLHVAMLPASLPASIPASWMVFDKAEADIV